MMHTTSKNGQAHCWVCEQPERVRLVTCSKCRHPFHWGSCGVVPEVPDIESIDPDDILRGQYSGGPRLRKDWSHAVCDVCSGVASSDRATRLVHFANQRRYEEEKRQARLRRDRMAREVEQRLDCVVATERKLTVFIDEVSRKKKQIATELEDVNRRIDRAKARWRTLRGLISVQGQVNNQAMEALSMPEEQVRELSLLPLLCEVQERVEREGRALVRTKNDLNERLNKLEDELRSAEEERKAKVVERTEVVESLDALLEDM